MDTSQTSQITKPVNFELPVVPIAPDGDVIFVVGDEKRPLRVHSVFLRTASSVFKAMLGPHYREGANLSSDCPKVIPLPEDDPKAMEIIFNIIHFRFDAVSERYDPESVLCLAIAADKYDFTQALRLSIRDWLQCDNIKDPKKLWKLTKASYFLHNDRAFEATTLGLICHYGGSFFQLNDGNEIYFDFGDRFAAMMEDRRSRLRLEVVCRYARSRSQKKIRHGISESELNTVKISTASLCDTIKHLSVSSENDSFAVFDSIPPKTNSDELVQVMIEEFVTKGLGGLCLTCVRTGKDHQSHSSSGRRIASVDVPLESPR